MQVVILVIPLVFSIFVHSKSVSLSYAELASLQRHIRVFLGIRRSLVRGRSQVSENDYKRAILEYMYPQIVNINIGFLRLQNTVRTSTLFSSSMREMCITYKVKCSRYNYKSKLISVLNPIEPGEVMAHMIVRSRWLKTMYSDRGNNWFNLTCHSPQCGFTLYDQPDGQHIRSLHNVYQGIYEMMKNMLSNPNLRIKETKRWLVDEVVDESYIKQSYDYRQYIEIENEYSLKSYNDKCTSISLGTSLNRFCLRYSSRLSFAYGTGLRASPTIQLVIQWLAFL